MKKLCLITLIITSPLCYGEVFNLVCTTYSNNVPTEKQFYIDTDKRLVKLNEESIKVKKLNVDPSNIKFEFPDNIMNTIFRTNYVIISRVTGTYKEFVVNDQDYKDQFSLAGKCEPRKQNKF